MVRPRVFFLVAMLVALAAGSTALAEGGDSESHHRTGHHKTATKRGRRLTIEVLSGRANLVSGGEALVAVVLPHGVKPARVKMTLGHRNVTREFAMRANGSYEGLLTGIPLGRHVLRARAAGHKVARMILVDHSVGGPVFSGPQVQPWVCLNKSKSPKCNAPTTYSYQYMSSLTGQLKSYNPSKPPSDVATTTTENGTKVPFIIRFETGYQDRDQYQIAVLYQPGKPWTAWKPQAQFVHKLLITHGASCGINHESGTAPSTTTDTVGVPNGPSAGGSPTTALGMGFAVMSTALDNAGHNCNLVTEAESLVMAKQHLIAHYGTLRFTIGTGCSGGSLVQQQVANAYPGIYQGILPQCSFPDAWSTGQQLASYHLTRGYFESPQKWGTGIAWTPTQIAAVEGHPNYGNVVIFDSFYWEGLADPSGNPNGTGVSSGCSGVTTAEEYNEKTRPNGVRCTLMDYMINVLGPRKRSVWSPWEKKVGHGFGGIPLDDVGIQAGLNALKDGTISAAQFVDLNAKLGGEDIDLHTTAARFSADEPALRNAYRSGAINETNNLVNVPIIDLRGPDPGAFHDAYRSWTIRARLQNQEGHFPKNDVIWFGETPLIGDPQYTVEGLKAMDRWLDAVEADHRNISLASKVADDRPTDVHDQCSDIPGLQLVNVPGVGEVCELPAAQTRFATPVMEAGESVATDVMKCKLVPLRKSDYSPITFTAAEWSALEKAFPTGVCDYAERGVDQQNTIPWLSYQSDAAGRHVVYGGRALGAAPAHSGLGWTSPSFDTWLGR